MSPSVGGPARVRRAWAGIVQGLLDFPRQDGSELDDSLESFQSRSQSFAMFEHPKLLIELCLRSRSREKMIDVVGCCPYLLLSHLVVTHNAEVLREAEMGFAELACPPEEETSLRTRPLGDLQGVLDSIDTPLVDDERKVLLDNLRNRVDIFRRIEFEYLPNIFRYPTERRTYEELSRRRGLVRRHADLVARLDRYSKLVHDLHEVSRRAAEGRMNRLLFVLAMVGVISATTDFGGLFHAELASAYPFTRSALRWIGSIVAATALVMLVFLGAKEFLPLVRHYGKRRRKHRQPDGNQ
jgi:hypothetical protein